jgi:ABC-type branched-subunit amino acid transport system ATPase component
MRLQISQITRRFGGVCALVDVSFSVESGSVHGLIGPNGAGKTTLINILSGITRPNAGRIILGDTEIQTLPAYRIAEHGVARTFQNIKLFPTLTCLENVIAGQHLIASRPLIPRLLFLPSSRRTDAVFHSQATAILEKVGLLARAGLQARYLSYGERRRLEIARALASHPRLLLLDEPVAGMRRQETLDVAALIGSLAREGMTILLIEHNMSFVMSLCARITVLNFGSVLTTGSPEEVINHPAVIEAYLGKERRDA